MQVGQAGMVWWSDRLTIWVVQQGWQKTQLGLFLIPTLVYGIMFLGQKMPKSEASEKGLSFGEMLAEIWESSEASSFALIFSFSVVVLALSTAVLPV